MKLVLPIVTGFLLCLSSAVASAHSCSSTQIKKGCWEERAGYGIPQCYCPESEAGASSGVENPQALDNLAVDDQSANAEDLVVFRVSSGQALGTLNDIVRAAKSIEARSPGSCTGRNCEWIGFCYCGGAGGNR